MLSAADRNPDGEQADYEQALDCFARLVLKDRETWNRKPPNSRARLAQALVQSQVIGGSGPDPLATAALLCEYLVLGGEEPERVAGAFTDHARTLPVPSEYQNSAHWPVLHVFGTWAERKSEEDVRAAVVAAGGEVFRFIYENGNRALEALDLADHVKRLPGEDAPPAELILLPYREWLNGPPGFADTALPVDTGSCAGLGHARRARRSVCEVPWVVPPAVRAAPSS